MVIAAGSSPPLFHSVLQQSWRSLCLNTLFKHHVMFRVGSIIHCVQHSSGGSRANPNTEPAFFQFVQFIWVSGSYTAVPSDGCKADYTLHHILKIRNILLLTLIDLGFVKNNLLHPFL